MSNPLRRCATLALYWEEGHLVCEDYLTHRRAALGPGMVDLLEAFDRPANPALASARSANGRQSHETQKAIRALLNLGFLKKGEDKSEKAIQKWGWGQAARHFFLGTKDAHGFLPVSKRLMYANELLKRSRQPSLYKVYAGRPAVRLKKSPSMTSETGRVLSRLRNVRDFARRPIAIDDLNEILFLAWGRQEEIDVKPWGRLLEKTSYSAGNRHPVEVYVVVSSVSGLQKGLYHYNVRNHSLELLKKGDFEAMSRRIANRQEWVRNASAYFLMTAIFSRTMFKYRHDYALRTIFGDVGHLSQSMYITAAALGLGACTTYAIRHSLGEKFLALDGINESLLSLSAVGHPTKV